MSKPEDYTVGWICAISTEYTAATASLDEEHEPPTHLPPNHKNDYTLGKMGQHNVVISVLPMGEYGTSSAAQVAEGMVHAFPNIRLAFMVGIGGGAPSAKHDIRLGDIVVGIPHNGRGGILQYDFGKTIQDQSFQQTGFTNQAPTFLRTPVSGLASQYERKGNPIDRLVTELLVRYPRLRKKYSRPDPATDRLYKSDVVHPGESDGVAESSCAVACGERAEALVLRAPRTDEEDDPAIHYGLIASANQLMKDARVRDEFARKHGVLCFEMEAAGLVNHFPCLVVRGICDYADSHKNKEWQGYAAMTAALYAKELLGRIVPQVAAQQEKITQVLKGGDTYHNSTVNNYTTQGDNVRFDGNNYGVQVGMNHGDITNNR
ncbi:hypothetical protein N7466_011472 [Penicillium verhagenii]|uniref:uncharacterized protein n=1 Tax=Penicillium verhagenii TaxID=1562060 RepID=UPI002544F7F6|nr:uncharacterized protein N7466_011472 [Penicillium verhagenii]KAJ5915539.1 hypothetical protein N7466_011472 [Penicillium verhagenii]